jgi:hypothetical protein
VWRISIFYRVSARRCSWSHCPAVCLRYRRSRALRIDGHQDEERVGVTFLCDTTSLNVTAARRERTVAGLNAARTRGRKGGRPAELSPKEIKTIRALLKSPDIPVREIAARFGIARSTLYRAVLKPAV